LGGQDRQLSLLWWRLLSTERRELFTIAEIERTVVAACNCDPEW
jgi:hypothetical protein